MPEKKKTSFLKSLRFRILIILVILGIVPSVIVAHVMVAAYESKAVAVRKQTVEKQCDILCNLLIKENYMNDSSSQDVNSKLELLSNVYDGRILLVDRDYRIIKDTYGVDEAVGAKRHAADMDILHHLGLAAGDPVESHRLGHRLDPLAGSVL